MQLLSNSATDGIRHLYLPKLNAVTSVEKNGLRYWLANSDNFIPNFDTSNNDLIRLTIYDPDMILRFYASDIARLSNASVETIENISPALINDKFLAWQLIEYYYSAFYSAHSILKINNFGLTQIDGNIISNIKKRASTLSMNPPNINGGQYCTYFDLMNNSLVLSRVRKYDDSHKGLWKRFSDYLTTLIGLNEISNNAGTGFIQTYTGSNNSPHSIYSQIPINDAQAIVDRFELILFLLNSNGDSNWLSSTRNLINYNQMYGVWYPYKDFAKSHSSFISQKDLYRQGPLCKDLMPSKEESLKNFVICCQFINSLCYDILVDLSVRHPLNKSFLTKGPFAFLNKIMVKSQQTKLLR